MASNDIKKCNKGKIKTYSIIKPGSNKDSNHILSNGSKSMLGLPWWLSSKESACQCRRHGFDPWVRKIPWRRKWQPTLVFLPGQRSLETSRQDHKESGMTE